MRISAASTLDYSGSMLAKTYQQANEMLYTQGWIGPSGPARHKTGRAVDSRSINGPLSTATTITVLLLVKHFTASILMIGNEIGYFDSPVPPHIRPNPPHFPVSPTLAQTLNVVSPIPIYVVGYHHIGSTTSPRHPTNPPQQSIFTIFASGVALTKNKNTVTSTLTKETTSPRQALSFTADRILHSGPLWPYALLLLLFRHQDVGTSRFARRCFRAFGGLISSEVPVSGCVCQERMA